MTSPPPDWKAAAAAATEAREDAKQLAGGTSAFAARLYSELAAGHGNNVFFSPAGLASVLAMTHAGARNETAAEIAAVLSLPDLPADRLHTAFATLAAGGSTDSGVDLRVANALFAQIGENWLPEFLTLLDQRYRAPLRQINFKADAERAAQGINHWVRQQTKGLVDGIVAPGTLNERTRLVLANAIHFKGRWSTPFPKKLTRDAPFQLRGGGAVPVPMMHRQAEFALYEMAGVQFLDLPYESSSLSMTIVLPRNPSGLPTSAAELATTLLLVVERMNRQGPREVDVYLPRFRLDATLRAGAALRAMGIEQAFDDQRADLSGMNGSAGDLFVGAVQQRAMVEVDEVGTVAAAATSLSVVSFGLPTPPELIPVFRADHPFLFLIRDARTNNILFVGRVMDPRG